MPRDIPRDRRIERQVQARLRRTERTIGEDLERLRIDTAATKAEVARVAGIDRTFYGRMESGRAHPGIDEVARQAFEAIFGPPTRR